MSPADDVPARIRWAVDLLDPAPTDHVLEIGCGPGVAALVVAERLTSGRILAIDRSATAVERTAARGRDHVTAGRLVVRRAAATDLAGEGLTFDKAFAINVNLFWTSTAESELAVLRAALGGGGSLVLVYETPAGRATEIADRVATVLVAQGFASTKHQHPDASLVAIVARPD
jgi:precorrin-6B methylase 2